MLTRDNTSHDSFYYKLNEKKNGQLHYPYTELYDISRATSFDCIVCYDC